MANLTFGSLFAGIGGIDLGFERAGMVCKWQVEIDDYCNKVLAKHWPDVARYGDVREVGKHNLETVDVIAGGFPCQPHSVAGKRKGAADNRNLWPEYLRIVDELRPTWVVGENVPGIANTDFESVFLGMENKTILRKQDSDYYRRIYTLQKNLFLDKVCNDLKSIGYQVAVFEIPAVAFDAKHLRYRIFVVAYAASNRRDREREVYQRRRQYNTVERSEQFGGNGEYGNVAHAQNAEGEDVGYSERSGFDRYNRRRAGTQPENGCQALAHAVGEQSSGWDNGTEWRQRCEKDPSRNGGKGRGVENVRWPTEPDVGGTLDGFSAWLDRTRLNESHVLYLAYANAKKERPAEILRILRSSTETKDQQSRETGRSGNVSETQILLAYLRELQERETNQTWLQLAGTQAPENEVRSVPARNKPSCSPHRSRHFKQSAGKHPDTLQELSRLLAQHAEAAWLDYCGQDAETPISNWNGDWERGTPRVATGIPNRVDRLRGLGNAVVPQVAEFIGGLIVAADQERRTLCHHQA